MRVIKRGGECEDVSFDKVLNRIKILSKDLSVDVYDVSQKVCSRIYDQVKTSELDELAAHICSSMIVDNPDYGTLASRIIVSNHHKNTSPSFSETIVALYNNMVEGERCPLVTDVLYEVTMKNKEKLNSYIAYERDYNFDYFGFKTLERSYLIKINNKVVERPQHMFMRVSLGIHSDDLKEALITYDLMSKKYFTHATPTLFNAGTVTPQLSSCFVAGTMVYTLKGCKPIEEVEIGDEVITHMGRPKKVVQKHINPLGDRKLFDFKVYNTPSITATDNHEFMSITSEQIEWETKPQWNRLDALRVGDYIEIPKYSGSVTEPEINLKNVFEHVKGDGDRISYSYEYDEDNNKIQPFSLWSCQRTTKRSGVITVNFKKALSKINMKWKIDHDFCKFLGVWYGDGHVIQDRNSCRHQVPKGVGFTLHKENQNLFEFLSEYGENVLGVKASIRVVKAQNVTQVLFHSTPLGHAFAYLFGKYYDNKKLYTDIHNWDTQYVESLLCGLITSDGFVTSNGGVRVGMSNPKFLRDVYNLARSRGLTLSYCQSEQKYINSKGELASSPTAYVTIPRKNTYMKHINKTYKDDRIERFAIAPSSQQGQVKIIDGRIFLRISSKVPSEKNDNVVYTLGVEDDHSYMVDGIIAKNCFLESMEGDSIDGIFNTVKDCARISKHAGGIGLHIHNIRSKGSRIRSTNGVSDGLVPMLKVFNHVGRYINQCFTPETVVFAENGTMKMKDVDLGDMLLTYDFLKNESCFKSVLGISQNHIEEEILEIRTAVGNDCVRVTKAHELYVKGSDGGCGFISADKLVVGDMMAYPEKNDLFWFKIIDIKPVMYKGDVYDFNMEDNHNYTVMNLGLVHNSGKRNGSIAIYLEPWHSDVEAFLDLKKNHGNEEDRARDLFYALWIPDLFMHRVQEGKMWSLMCPDKSPGLSDVWGAEFVALYEKYESEGKFVKQMPAQELWFKILESQIETGTPYLCYKDASNAKSNQMNLGTIKSSNLCTEIIEYSDPTETAVCNLSSICLPTYIVKGEDGSVYYDFDKLHEIAMIATKNLNKIIDINYYPIEKARKSNLRHRPIGIGIQGLADTYILMGYPFDSPMAFDLNKKIFETIYHGAVEASMLIAKKRSEMIAELASENMTEARRDEIKRYLNLNEYESISGKYPGAYETFDGSPASQGKLQFDLWGVDPGNERYDWAGLKADIMKYGMRNSLLLAPMPTASTSQIMGFTESFECITSNLYKRKTLAGEFVLVNKYLISDLIKAGLWNKEMKNKIMVGEGSIQHIQEIPEHIRALYKTVWEMSQKVVIDQSADRGPFICQSQSLNLFLEDPTFQALTSMHMYAFKKGLKTGCYYLRSKPIAKVQQFTIEPPKKPEEKKKVVCTDEVCTVCSS